MSDDWGEPPSITDDDWGEPPSTPLPSRDIRPLAKQRLDRLKNDALPWSPNTSGSVGQLTPELNTVFDAVAGANDKLDQFAQGQVDTKRRLQQEREAALRRGNITGQDLRLAAIPAPKPKSGLESLFDRRPTPDGYDPEQDKPNALTAIAATVRAALGGAGAISPDATPIARARLRPTAPQVEPGGGVRLPPQAEPAPPIPMRMPPDLRSKAAERYAALRAQEPQEPNVQPLFAGKGLGEAPETTYPTYFAPPSKLVGASAPVQAYRGASEWMHGASADFGRWATESPDSALARLIKAGEENTNPTPYPFGGKGGTMGDLAQLTAGVTKGGVQVAAEVAPTVAEFAALNALVPGGSVGAAVHAGTKVYFAKDGVEMLTQTAKDAPGVMERGDPDEIGRALANTAMAVGMIAPAAGVRRDVRDARFLRENPELSRNSPQLQADVAHYTSPLGAAERAVASTPPRAFAPDMAALATAAGEGRPPNFPRPPVDLPEGFEPLPPVEGPPAPLTLRDRLAMQGMRGQAHPLPVVEGQGAGPFQVPPDVRAQAGTLPADLRRVDPRVADTLATILTGEEAPTLPVRAPGPQPGLSWQERQVRERGEPVPPPPPPGPIQRPPRQSAPEIRPDQTFQALQEARRRGMDPEDILNRILDESDLASRVAVQREVGSESEVGAQLLRAERIANDATQSAKKRKAAANKAEQLRAQLGGADAGPAPVQPPPAASRPAEPAPAGPAPAEVQPEPVGRPAVAPASPRATGRAAARERAPGSPEKYTIADYLGAEKETDTMEVQVLRNKDGTIDAFVRTSPNGAVDVMKASPRERVLPAEEAIAIAFGSHAEGSPPDLSRVARLATTPEPVGRPAVAPADGVAEAVARRLYGDEALPASVDFVRRVLAGEPPPTADPKFVAKILAAAKKVTPASPPKSVAPAAEPRSERLAPESKEQLDAQLAAVGEGSKPGVFYPVQNGHEMPDTPPGLARVNGEQGSLIFDPKRVPVEKAQQAVDTGENLHEVIGMSGPREGDVAVTTRDARGVPITDEQTADVPRAVAAATPPEGGSVEVRPLAAVIEERQAANEEPPRERLVREAKDAGMGTPEQVDAVAQVWDARAKQWARETGQSVGQFFQKFFGGVKKGGAPKGSLKQGEAPVFYSKLRRVVEGMKSPVTPEQLRGYLKAQGVKAEEMEWTNLDSALEGKRLVRPEELLKHLDANEVKLEEVQHGTTPQFEAKFAAREAADNAAYERMAQARMALEDAASSSGVVVNPNFSNNSFMLREDGREGRKVREGLRQAGHDNLLREYDRALDEWIKASERSWPQIGGETKYEQYQVPGGEGYHELLLTLPRKTREVVIDNPRAPVEVRQNVYGDGKWRLVDKTGEWSGESYRSKESAEAALREAQARGTTTVRVTDPSYQSQHWEEPNVLVHVRANSRDGGKTLHLEEVQSDWHQQGKRQGYASDARPAWELWADEAGIAGDSVDYSRLELAGAPPEVLDSFRRDGLARGWGGVGELPPDAPFKKTWPELALKRMLRYAAENGYERVTWTTGETQAERYDLSKQVSDVRWEPRDVAEDGRRVGLLEARDTNGNRVMYDILAEDKLPDHVGKELADRIIQRSNRHPQAGPLEVHLSGLDLKVGGEGMKGFYDKILPSVANGLAKKFGTRVGEHTIEGDVKVHSLEVTQAMRDSVMEGQPLFQKAKGAVSFMEDGKAVIHALEQPDVSTFIHETAHVFRRTLADADRAIAERVYGVKNGEWKRAHEERWATDFEHYAMTGKAPTTALARVFEQFKQWLSDIYKSVKGTEVHPEIKALFDRMLGAEEGRPVERKAKDAEGSLGQPMPTRQQDLTRKAALEVRRRDLASNPSPETNRNARGARQKQELADIDGELGEINARLGYGSRGPTVDEAVADMNTRVGAPDLAPTPERKANVRADELVSKVLGDNIGAMRRQAAMGAIDELVAGRPATKGVFTLPEENAIRAELGLPARKLAPGKAGVATAPKLRGGKSLGAGAGGAGGMGPDPDLLGSRVLHALTGIKDVFRKTPGGEAPVGESVADAPAPPPAPKTGRIWDNISEVASFRNRWGSIAQNVLAELDPKAFHFVREAEAARSTAAQAVVIAKARMLKAARASLKDSGLKGRFLDLAAQTRADDGMTYLENSRNFGLNRRWRDLKEKVEGMTDEKLLEAADSHVIKIPIEALSRKSIFEGEDLAGNLAKAVKAGDAKAVRELVTTAYRDAIDAYAPREFSDSTETLESMHEKPWIKEMRDAWADGPGKLLAKVHGENPAKPGSFIPEEYMGPSKTYFPGIEADARNKTRAFERPTYGIQSNIDNHFATGISDTGYSHEVKDLVDSIGHSVVANGRASTLEQLKKTGIARPLMKGEKASDTEPMEFGGRLVKTVAIATKAAYKIAKDGTIQKAMDVQHYVIPDQINRELAPVFEKSKIDQKGLAKIVTDIQNSTQMAGITDLAYHSINIFNVGLQDAPMIARYLGGELKAAETFSDMLKIITGGDLTEAGNQARLTRMADNGQLSPRAFQSTFDSAQAEYLGIGSSLGFRKGIDPHTGKMRYNPLGFNLEPILSGTGRGMDLAIDTRARLLLDKVGEYIFERSNPGKKWADHPHEQFMWTKQLGVYHSGIEGEWIRVMKDVPILGRVGPFMTAATTMTKGGVAGLVGGTLHMPVKPGDQMLNRWRAYGVTAGLVVPVAAWVLAYKNATGKMPWEDPDSEPGRVPVSKEFRESAIGKKLFGNDLTKAGTVDMWRFSLAKRGFRAIGGFGAIRQAREGGSAKDIFFGAATDAINDWSHGMAGPSVHNMLTLFTGYEPRLRYDARVGHPRPVEAYRGRGSAIRNIEKAAEGLNPIIKNAFESKEKEKSLGRSLLDSAGVGSMFGTVRPRMDKMQKLLSLRRPIIERQLEPEKLAEYDYIRKTTAALRHGEDKEKVMADLRERVKAGFIGEGKAKDIVEAAAMPDWYDDFEGANVEDAADAWLVATPEQRKRLGGIMSKKVKHWQGLATQKNLSKTDRDRIKAKIAKAVAAR